MRRLRDAGTAAMWAAGAALVLTGNPALAQQAQTAERPVYDSSILDELKSCQGLIDDAERLACFDAKVAGLVAANDAGDVQLVDREDVRETRRSLFGFSLPDLGIFGGSEEEEEELFTTTIASVRYFGRSGVRFTTAEGAVWEMNNVPSRLRTIKPGDTAEFKEASLGFYFVRIENQMGVKGKRIE